MKVTRREAILFVATAGTALLGGTILLGRPRLDAWRETRTRQEAVRQSIERDREILLQQDKWDEEFRVLGKALPLIPADQKVDVHWLAIMDQVAARHGFKIIKRKVGDEKPLGDVYELDIECNEWEGTLDSLVLFLIDLQSQGAMLDLRQVLVKPKGAGILRGRFVLNCAYRREGVSTEKR